MGAPAVKADRDEILRIALDCGFDVAGIAPAEVPAEDIENFRRYIALGRHGAMDYLEKFRPARENPDLVMKGARSALVLGVFYNSQEAESLLTSANLKISRYALGPDYHTVLRKRGWILKKRLKEAFPAMRTRFCVDTAPVAEKTFAREAGIAFRGKHTNMIHPGRGSYFFLAVMLLEAQVDRGEPLRDRCGSCRLCIDACPTKALEEYRIDPRKCISYLTIETPEPIPQETAPFLAGNVFGCDICQEVCPYNKPLPVSAHWPDVRPAAREFLKNRPVTPGELIEGSALVRINEEKLKDNLAKAGSRAAPNLAQTIV